MPNTTLTLDGEHWDEIALRIYGTEIRADFLMRHNMQLLDIQRFKAGVVVNVPDIPVEAVATAPWRREP